jgi:hypothetical protein
MKKPAGVVKKQQKQAPMKTMKKKSPMKKKAPMKQKSPMKKKLPMKKPACWNDLESESESESESEHAPMCLSESESEEKPAGEEKKDCYVYMCTTASLSQAERSTLAGSGRETQDRARAAVLAFLREEFRGAQLDISAEEELELRQGAQIGVYAVAHDTMW